MRYLAALAIIACLFAAPGCNTDGALAAPTKADILVAIDAARAEKDRLEAEIIALQPYRDALAAEIEAMQAGAERDAAAKVLASYEDAIGKYRELADRAEAAAAAAEFRMAGLGDGDTTAGLDAAIGAATVLLPQPWGAVAGLVGGLGLGLFRSHQQRQIAREIVKSVDKVVDGLPPDAKTAIAARQTVQAERVVDEAQGKRRALPF